MIVAIIPAKGESSRLANKNMAQVNAKPMIYYSIEYVKQSKLVDEIYISTDSDAIADYAKSQDVKVIRRGAELSGDAPIVEVYYHALNSLDNPNIDIVAGIQPDHPDRRVELDKALTYLLEKKYDELLTVDGAGSTNGSLKIMKAKLLRERTFVKVATMMDDCTNIHHLDDLKQAEKNLA